MNALIFVAPEVFEQGRSRVHFTHEEAPTGSGYVLHLADGRQVRGRELLNLLEEWRRKDMEERGGPPETPEMEYRALLSLPRGDAGGLLKPAAK